MLTAGTKVQGGYYLNRDRLDLIAIGGKEGVLPGDAGQRYQRIPAWMAVLLAPMAGGIFAMAMPLVGIAVVAHHIGSRLFGKRQAKKEAPGSAGVGGDDGEKGKAVS
jgi:hypothetical protein